MKRIVLLLLLLASTAAFGGGVNNPGGGGGIGDALVANPLSQFAPTTSSQFKGVISDENAPDGASSKVIMALGSLSIASGKTGTFSNTITLAGTDGTTMTVPTTNATLARTDAANTFTGTQTFSGLISGAAGTTSLAPVNLPQGTLKTTPAAGDVESDATNLYGTSDAGNRGYIPLRYIIRAHTTVTYANDANPHPIFTTPTNGTLTVAAGTYRFHGMLAMSSMSATSGSCKIDILGAGTAVATNWLWSTTGADVSPVNTLSAQSGGFFTASASGTNIVSPAANAAVGVFIDGTFEVSTGGTIIPSQTQTTAAAAVLTAGSYIEFWRVGTAAATSVGAWN